MEKTSADMMTTNIGQEGDEKVDEDMVLLVETAIAAAQSIAYNDAAGPERLQEAIDTIFEAEKKARLAGELSPTRKACLAILDLCDELKDWSALNQNVLIISKRRAQLKQVIKECVEKAMVFLDKETDVDKRLELLDTLRSVTEGKIFVEMERARLTRSLVQIKEDQGKVEEACNLLQEVQVETIGEMSKREKTAYILDQMRLCLAKGDIVRTAIISKKINPKVFADSTLQDLKVQYYDLMIQKDTQDKAYLEIAKSYFAIFDTPSVQKELPEFEHLYSGKWAETLKCVVIFLILAPHDNEQSDFINRIAVHKQLDDLPSFKSLTKKFVTDEIFKMTDLTAAYEAEMAAVGAAFPADKSELAKERWKVRKTDGPATHTHTPPPAPLLSSAFPGHAPPAASPGSESDMCACLPVCPSTCLPCSGRGHSCGGA
jgi:26S proteasome regulatory subunit N5